MAHSHYMNYYLSQAQTGSGMSYYAGAANQRGGGFFGNLISGLFRFVSPLLPTLKQEALRAGSHVLADVASGSQSLGTSIKKHASEAGQNVIKRTADRLQGNGIKRGRLTRRAQSTRGRRPTHIASNRGRRPARTASSKQFTAADIYG